MAEEPRDARTEFFMAVAGPIMSFVLALFFYGAFRPLDAADTAVTLSAILYYLAGINLALGLFNLVPGFPLDGGRMLRAALWAWKRDLHWATRVAARLGSAVGLALIVLGAVTVARGDFIGGMWWFLIGLFLRNAAAMSYRPKA